MKNLEAIPLDNDIDVKLENVSYNRVFPATMSTSSFVRLYILHLLSNKETYYGKELIDEIERKLGQHWRPSHGMVYPMLRELEKNGYLNAEWTNGDKKTTRIYKITDLGIEALREELETKRNMFTDSYNLIVNVLEDLYDVSRPKLLNVKKRL